MQTVMSISVYLYVCYLQVNCPQCRTACDEDKIRKDFRFQAIIDSYWKQVPFMSTLGGSSYFSIIFFLKIHQQEITVFDINAIMFSYRSLDSINNALLQVMNIQRNKCTFGHEVSVFMWLEICDYIQVIKEREMRVESGAVKADVEGCDGGSPEKLKKAMVFRKNRIQEYTRNLRENQTELDEKLRQVCV